MRLADLIQVMPYTQKGKHSYEVVMNDSALEECVDTFNRTNATADEMEKLGETLFPNLYGSKAWKTSFSRHFVTLTL